MGRAWRLKLPACLKARVEPVGFRPLRHYLQTRFEFLKTGRLPAVILFALYDEPGLSVASEREREADGVDLRGGTDLIHVRTYIAQSTISIDRKVINRVSGQVGNGCRRRLPGVNRAGVVVTG